MTTRELIEAVREPERRMADGLVLLGYDENGDPKTAALVTVNATDYDALRAATLAVLDDLGNSGAFNGHSGNQGLANDDCLICRAVDNARALRERLK